MPSALSSPGARIRGTWARLSGLPGGRWLFSKVLGFLNPYSGALGARVETLEPGHAVVTLRERRGVRNHLASIHAIAMMNLAEMTSGLAMLAALPDTARGIVTGIAIEYAKKGRGTLTAESRCDLPDVTVDGEHRFVSLVRDEAGDEVARATVTWRLGPVRPAAGSPARAAARG